MGEGIAMIKALVKAYAFITRKFRKVKISDSDIYNLPAGEFSRKINEMKYKADPLGGAVDYVADPDRFFDSKRKHGRDCDDWARQWSLWGIRNGYLAEEYFVYNPKRLFKTAHVVTLLWRDGFCFLANYHLFGPFKLQEEALDYLKNYEAYKDGLEAVMSIRLTP